MDAFRDNRIRGCVNVKSVHQAMVYQDAAVRPSKFVKLPAVTERYALPGTKLYDAWHPVADGNAPVVEPPETDYINGVISRAEYDQRRAKLDEQKDPRRELVQAWVNKTYDPLQDMYVPTAGPQSMTPLAGATAAADGVHP